MFYFISNHAVQSLVLIHFENTLEMYFLKFISRSILLSLIFLFLSQYPGSKAEKRHEVPALLRIKLWFGLQGEEEAWHRMQKEGEMAVFAETVRVLSIKLLKYINHDASCLRKY